MALWAALQPVARPNLSYGPGFGLVNSAVLTRIIAYEMKRKDDGVCQLNTLCLWLERVGFVCICISIYLE